MHLDILAAYLTNEAFSGTKSILSCSTQDLKRYMTTPEDQYNGADLQFNVNTTKSTHKSSILLI